MTVLMSIGDVEIDSATWAVQGWPRQSYQRVLSEYELADGDYEVRFRSRRAPTMSIVLAHAPGQPFDSGQLFSPRRRTAAGQGWHAVVQTLIDLGGLVDAAPVAVAIGDLEMGTWWVEAVDPSGDDAVIAGGDRGGYAPTVLEVTIRLKGSRDAITDHTPPTSTQASELDL